MSAHSSAVDLLKLGDESRTKPFVNQYWPQILGIPFGIGSAAFHNFGTRRPLLSGIQKHVLLAAVWTGLLTFAQYKRDEYYMEKDAVFRHYIELHPEDFVEPERKKIGDILEDWIPIR